MPEAIEVRNARVHNLRGISLDIPRDRLVVFTGVSGSGKSSLVFDTLHTEAQRQLLETFSSFSRRYLPKLSRPDVDEIRNLGTSIVIDQKRLGRTLRSTVGTATEVYTYLRMLYSRCGDGEHDALLLLLLQRPAGLVRVVPGPGQAHPSRHRPPARPLAQPARRRDHPPRLQGRRLGLDARSSTAACSMPTSRWPTSRPKRWNGSSTPRRSRSTAARAASTPRSSWACARSLERAAMPRRPKTRLPKPSATPTSAT